MSMPSAREYSWRPLALTRCAWSTTYFHARDATSSLREEAEAFILKGNKKKEPEKKRDHEKKDSPAAGRGLFSEPRAPANAHRSRLAEARGAKIPTLGDCWGFRNYHRTRRVPAADGGAKDTSALSNDETRMDSETPYASPRTVTDLADCYFYHTLELPGYGLVEGEWDLRAGAEAYLGGVDFRGRRVLEVGPASGFLCF